WFDAGGPRQLHRVAGAFSMTEQARNEAPAAESNARADASHLSPIPRPWRCTVRPWLSVHRVSGAIIAGLLIGAVGRLDAQHAVRRAIDGRPRAVVDLRTAEGGRLVKGEWRYHDTTIVEADFNAPGADLRPSGKPIKTNDLTPKAGVARFDDSGWQVIEPPALEDRRSNGKLAFNWYRTVITIPELVGAFSTA